MHLGRFHATIYDLAHHFTSADLPAKLEQCIAVLEQYVQSKAQTHLDTFHITFEKLLNAAEIKNPDLKQPYAQRVIEDLSISDAMNPSFTHTVKNILQKRTFDHTSIATDLRLVATKITKNIAQITAMYNAFSELNVEFERVHDSEAEIGILLPREIVGESLAALTTEFNKFNTLFRAINELTAAQDYDPKIRTISSSWWQVFLDLDTTQVVVWVIAIERIVTLFKTNLEIKVLQNSLSKKEMPKEITDLIEKEIENRISLSLRNLASDIRNEHAKINDQARLNEIETQLRQGLFHLAMRINQGTHIEINIAIPDTPKNPPTLSEDEESNQEILAQIEAQRAKIAELIELRTRSQAASTETLKIDGSSQLLLKYLDESNKKQE